LLGRRVFFAARRAEAAESCLVASPVNLHNQKRIKDTENYFYMFTPFLFILIIAHLNPKLI
jgi:hypothetical protein